MNSGKSSGFVRVLAAAAFALAGAGSAFAQGKPNILIIWGDDIGQCNVSATTAA